MFRHCKKITVLSAATLASSFSLLHLKIANCRTVQHLMHAAIHNDKDDSHLKVAVNNYEELVRYDTFYAVWI